MNTIMPERCTSRWCSVAESVLRQLESGAAGRSSHSQHYLAELIEDLRLAQQVDGPPQSEVAQSAFLNCGVDPACVDQRAFWVVASDKELSARFGVLADYFEAFRDGKPVSAEAAEIMTTFCCQIMATATTGLGR